MLKNIWLKSKSILKNVKPLFKFYRLLKSSWKMLFFSPSGLVIDIGSSCNAKCPFCYRGLKGSTMMGGVMSEDIFNAIFEQIKGIKSIHEIRLYAFGEPLLNKNIGKYVDKLKTLNKKITVSTNTTNLDKNINSLMNLDFIQFSIEGWDKDSYEFYRKGLKFETTVHNLELFNEEVEKRRRLHEKTPERLIHLLINKKTNVLEYVKLWSKYCDKIVVDFMYPSLNWDSKKGLFKSVYNSELRDDYYRFKKTKKISDFYCNQAMEFITINSQGNVVACCSDFQQGVILGNYTNLKKSFSFINRLKITKQFYFKTPTICKDCNSFLKVDKLAYNKVITELQQICDHEKIINKF